LVPLYIIHTLCVYIYNCWLFNKSTSGGALDYNHSRNPYFECSLLVTLIEEIHDWDQNAAKNSGSRDYLNPDLLLSEAVHFNALCHVRDWVFQSMNESCHTRESVTSHTSVYIQIRVVHLYWWTCSIQVDLGHFLYKLIYVIFHTRHDVESCRVSCDCVMFHIHTAACMVFIYTSPICRSLFTLVGLFSHMCSTWMSSRALWSLFIYTGLFCLFS